MQLIVVTDAHWIIGHFATSGNRLLEVLNAPSSEFLHLTDVQIVRRDAASTVRMPKAVVRKSQIAIAAPATERHEAPEKRRHAFVNKRTMPAYVIISNVEIRGTIHLRGVGDSVSVLVHEMGNFFPVSQVTVTRAVQSESCELPVVIVNKAFISVFSIGNDCLDIGTRDVAAPPIARPEAVRSSDSLETDLDTMLEGLKELIAKETASRANAPQVGSATGSDRDYEGQR
ncbi:MAG TPA: hypothetical protein VG713_19495 [Pirellulales bacterium]|nr:hypothetical protein [Pirellulales bacterium]